MSLLRDIAASLQRGEDDQVAALVRQALDDGLDPAAILHDGLIAGMAVVGEQFREREIFLPDVLLAARAMYAGLGSLRPLLAAGGVPTAGTVVIGSVQGDLHDIGKNLVGIMLTGAGFEVIDLGNDVPPQRFVDAACQHGAGVIGLSALLTTTMPVMKDVVELVRARGLEGRIKVIIGGAPVSDAWARQIGADAYGYDAASAVERVRALVRVQA
jgi:5-methyltetrahydrofolate--homocysteine methyltransferase